MDLIYIWYHDKHVYLSKVFISIYDRDLGVEVAEKMLKFSFKFLRSHYFLTLFWFDEFCIVHPNPSTPSHVKIKITNLEFSRNKMCNIRRAINVWRQVLLKQIFSLFPIVKMNANYAEICWVGNLEADINKFC